MKYFLAYSYVSMHQASEGSSKECDIAEEGCVSIQFRAHQRILRTLMFLSLACLQTHLLVGTISHCKELLDSRGKQKARTMHLRCRVSFALRILCSQVRVNPANCPTAHLRKGRLLRADPAHGRLGHRGLRSVTVTWAHGHPATLYAVRCRNAHSCVFFPEPAGCDHE